MATGGTSVGATGEQDVDGLLAGIRWNDLSVLFNFPAAANYYPGNYGTVSAPNGTAVSFPAGFVAVSASFQNMVRKALGEFESVTNLTFTEVAPGDASNISVARTTSLGPDTPLGFRGYGFYPGSVQRAGDIWFDDSTAEVGDTAVIGRGTYMLVLHELGHAMGLKHGHETTGGAGNTGMTAEHDHNDYSIMSYRRYEGGPTTGTVSETYGRPQSLMMYDILALQTMYGANYTTNGGDTVYSFSTTTGQMLVNGVGGDIPGNGASGANRIYRTIWDGGGIDTYDLSNYTTNLVIDLAPGGRSTFSQGQLAVVDTATGQRATGNVFNALLFEDDPRSLIENATGGSGNDTITGNPASNTLTGNGGADRLDGGAGADALLGGQSNDTYVVDDAGDVVIESLGQGTDTVETSLAFYELGANVENLTFTSAAVLNVGFGNGLNNRLTGNEGSDSLTGNGGNDTYVAGGGDDYLFIDQLDGDIDAGEGYDAIFIQDTADAELDVGEAGAEWVYAWTGDDTLDASGSAVGVALVGEAGADTLIGSDHDDYLYIDAFDSVDAGDGYDALFVYQGSGQGAIDTVIDASAANAEWVLGGAGNDTITNAGDTTSVALSGGGGNDTITGGLGNDYLFGNEGADTFVVTSNAQLDAILDFEVGVDQVDLSGIAGIDDFAELAAAAIESGDSTYFDLGGGNQLLLYEVPLAALSAGDFIFA
jgi:serralysin